MIVVVNTYTLAKILHIISHNILNSVLRGILNTITL